MLKRLLRKKTKKQKTLEESASDYIRIVAFERVTKTSLLVGAVVVAILLNSGRVSSQRDTGDYIAVLELKGSITSNMQGDGYRFAETFKKATELAGAQAILIHASSPGGSPVQAEMIASMIESYTETDIRNRKPVLVSIHEVCASACLYALSPADIIYTHKNSLVGSIGVRMDSWDASELSERVGLNRVTLTTGEHKSLLDPFSGTSEEERGLIESELLNPMFQHFIDQMERSRGEKLSDDKGRLYSGMVWTGADAITLGLADKIQSSHDIERELLETTTANYLKRMNKEPFSLSTLIRSKLVTKVEAFIREL